MDIPFAQCDFEADAQITALANECNCPVLSEDSDNYIFYIKEGFIRLSSVEESVTETTINGSVVSYLMCRCYKQSESFPSIHRNVWPLFASLIGNDSPIANLKKFFPHIENSVVNKHNPIERIEKLLNWLKCQTKEEVLSHLTKSQRDELEECMKHHEPQVCNLKEEYSEKENIFKIVFRTTDESIWKTRCGESLPSEFQELFHEGKLPPFFLNIINFHGTILTPQVESVYHRSSYDCSRYIRQVIYGFLLKHTTSEAKSQKIDCCIEIKEKDRHGSELVAESVKPIFVIKNIGTQKVDRPLPSLSDVYSMKKDKLQDIILCILGNEDLQISPMPPDLKLLCVCISYWLEKSCCPYKEKFLCALVINIMYFNYILNFVVAVSTAENSIVSHSRVKGLSELRDSIAKENVESVRINIEKYLKKPGESFKFNVDTVYFYCELQTCILYTVYLNMLLARPFVHPKLHEGFSGTLLYNLVNKLLHPSCPNSDMFVADLLGGESALIEIFYLLKEGIWKIPEQKSTKGRKKSQIQTKTEISSESALRVFNRFELLNNFDEDL